ncbi:MAG: hypothetical protein CME61_05350 [Halobacteriovoraceae bacterium]|nr:hypothetical protein [Halobacteriovoraceae bacterium]
MTYLTIISSIAFLIYGILCIFTNHMVDEFERYGLIKFRILTGILEVLGGLGLLVGLKNKPIMLISSLGLTLLMVLGVITRIRVNDPLIQIIPAFALSIINFIIFYYHIK